MQRRETASVRLNTLALLLALFIAATPAAEQGGATSAESVRIASLAAGQAAGLMCSGVFVAGRSPDDVRREELDRLALVAEELYPDTVSVEPGSRSVIAKSRFGNTRRAAYREGVGCVLMALGSSIEDIPKLPHAPLAPPLGDSSRMRWPDGDVTSDEPLPAEIDQSALSRLVA